MSSLEKLEFVKPADIETRSFEIISNELAEKGIELDPANELVIKRVIHTSADFEYADTLVFSENATALGIEALKAGCSVVTDTKMAKAGINKHILERFGGEVHCFMSDPEVAVEAKKRSVTRAAVSMERAAKLEAGKKTFGSENATADNKQTFAANTKEKKENITMSINRSDNEVNKVKSHLPAAILSAAACAALAA